MLGAYSVPELDIDIDVGDSCTDHVVVDAGRIRFHHIRLIVVYSHKNVASLHGWDNV